MDGGRAASGTGDALNVAVNMGVGVGVGVMGANGNGVKESSGVNGSGGPPPSKRQVRGFFLCVICVRVSYGSFFVEGR